MTAETVLNNVLLEVGLDVTSAQISSGTLEMRQIVRFMNAAGVDVSRRAEWSKMSKRVTFAHDDSGGGNAPGGGTVTTSIFDLPDDFHEMAENGAVKLNGIADFCPVRAVVSPEQWEFLLTQPSTQPYYHLTAGQLQFSPGLDTNGATVRYVSKYWVEGKEAINQNGDNILVPERLIEKGAIWRWKRQKGLPFDDVLAEYEADILADIKADRGEA